MATWRRLSDEDLLARVRAGDKGAAAELAKRYAEPLFRMCCLLTGRAETALDLANETWAAVLKNIGEYRGKGRFSSYLFAVAHNICCKWWRGQGVAAWALARRRSMRVGTGPLTKLVRQEDAVEAERRWERTKAELDSLPPHLQAVVRARLAGYEWAQIAEMLGTGEEQVRKDHEAAVKRLRRGLRSKA